MGKNLISQKRGKGSSTFRSPSHRYIGAAKFYKLTEPARGVVEDIVHSIGHSSPIMELKFEDSARTLLMAPEGIKVGDKISYGSESGIRLGNVLPLKSIPEGTLVFNIENNPGDGGMFARSSGTSAKIMAKSDSGVVILLPSKKQKTFNPNCRACIGVVAGGGRTEKPFLKAGKKYHAMAARNKYWPKVAGVAMNAVSHPFGGSRTQRKGRPTIAPRDAPPGRKVGMIRPRHTGRNK
ncbi:MAG TPA: 50S ribosomal protein L2 [Candidatus Nanoarchaeia archaeon]|nr:50S ribosomal protein L2 [Candidatus Nanoarchaeia archaeon]